jgi:hypothetical protein
MSSQNGNNVSYSLNVTPSVGESVHYESKRELFSTVALPEDEKGLEMEP